jgi:hypothetical protein
MMLWYNATERKIKRRTIGGDWRHLIHRSSRYMRLGGIGGGGCNLIHRQFIHAQLFGG